MNLGSGKRQDFFLCMCACSNAFRDGGPWMIWDSQSFNMEEPNVNEREWAMGFNIGTTTM
jgi:hypothetical protein